MVVTRPYVVLPTDGLVIRPDVEVTGMGLREAKEAVEQPPSTLRSGFSKEDTRRFIEVLKAAGVNVRLQVQ